MAVGSERGTTNFDVLVVDQMFCRGTFTGSVQNTGTETSALEVLTSVSCPGTMTGSVVNITTLGVKGTHTGSLARLTNVETSGTVTGSKGVFTTVYVGGELQDVGTITGSFIKGTVDGAFVGSTVKTSGMLIYKSGEVGVTATNGTHAHGLGAAPNFISIIPSDASEWAGQVPGLFKGTNADATNIYTDCGTTGTVSIFAIV